MPYKDPEKQKEYNKFKWKRWYAANKGRKRKLRTKEERKAWRQKNPLAVVWSSMKQRCLSPKHKDYPSYGGRGIGIYEPWINDRRAYENYILETLGPKPSPKHSLDRIDNDGNYEPGNLRWATPSEQLLNQRRTSVNVRVTTAEGTVNVSVTC
jgi:hypothetical protein